MERALPSHPTFTPSSSSSTTGRKGKERLLPHTHSIYSQKLLERFRRLLQQALPDTQTQRWIAFQQKLLPTHYLRSQRTCPLQLSKQHLSSLPLSLRHEFLQLCKQKSSDHNRARLWVDQLGCFFIDQKLARTLACIDQCGLIRKTNKHGNHPVLPLEGIHFKPNSFGLAPLDPIKEHAFFVLADLLFPDKLLAAPSLFMQVSQVTIDQLLSPKEQDLTSYQAFGKLHHAGLAAEEVFAKQPSLKKTLRVRPTPYQVGIQGGLTIGYPPKERPSAILLHDLLALLVLFDRLIDKIPMKTLETDWQLLLALPDQKEELSIEELAKRFHALCKTRRETGCLEYRSRPPDRIDPLWNMSVKNREAAFKRYLALASKRQWTQALYLFEKYPALMEGESLQMLVDFPRALRALSTLMHKKAIAEIVKEVPFLLEKIDKQAFSALFLTSLLARPCDGKPDNYMVTIKWAKDTIKSLAIVSIDSDKAFKPHLRTTSRKHTLRHYCVLYALKGPMQALVDPTAARQFQALVPEEVCLHWMAKIDQRLQQVKQRPNRYEEIGLPLKWPRAFLEDFVETMRALQGALKQKVTHQELLERFVPLAALCYQKAYEQTDNPLEITQLFYHTRPVLECFLQQERSLFIEGKGKRQTVQAALQKEIEPPLLTFEQSIQELVQTIAWGNLPGDARVACYTHLGSLSFSIKVAHLDRSQLLSEGIQTGNAAWVQLALCNGAQCTPDVTGQTPLHSFCQVYHRADFDRAAVLQIADLLLTQTNVHPLLSKHDKFSHAPLHYLAAHATQNLPLFKTLFGKFLLAGADTEIKHPQTGETVLDCALDREQTALVHFLINQGAGVHVFADRALTFFEKHPSPEMLKRLEATSSRLALLRALRAISTPAPQKIPRGAFVLQGTHTGKVLLRPEVLRQLRLNKEGYFTKDKEQYGRRPVMPIIYAKDLLHAKGNPEMGGVEYAVGRFHDLTIRHGTPETELFRATDAKGRPYPILVSQTARGENLFTVLCSGQAAKKLAMLDLERLHNLIMTAFLLNPEDGNPSNFIFSRFTTPEGKISYQLISVDNDHAFVEPFVKGLLNKTYLNIKSILFCLDQMQVPLHPKTRELFLKLDPKTLLTRWLRDLIDQEGRYKQLFPSEELRYLISRSKHEPTVITIPFPPRSIAKIYDKILRLQKGLQQEPNATPLRLLYYIEPAVAREYAKEFPNSQEDSNLLQKSPSKAPLQRFQRLCGSFYSRSGKGFTSKVTSGQILKSRNIPKQALLAEDKTYAPQAALDELERIALQKGSVASRREKFVQGDPEPFKELLANNLREEVVNKVDFGKVKKCDMLIRALTESNTSFHKLHLKNCPLTDKQFEQILQNSPALTALHLDGCSELSANAIWRLAALCPHLERLQISQCQGIKTISPATFSTLTFPQLTKLVIKSTSLIQLEIKAIKMKQASLHCPALLRLILYAPKLRTLNLTGCARLTLEPLRSLVRSLSLTTLHLPRGTLFRQERAYVLCEKYPFLIHSKRLGSLPNIYLKVLMHDLLIQEKQTQCKWNEWGDENFQILGLMLANFRIQTLSISRCTFNERKGKDFAAALLKGQIRFLKVGKGSSMSVGGAKAIVSAIRKSHIRKLRLRSYLAAGTMSILASLLPKSRLRTLDLDCYYAGNKHAKAIAKALPKSELHTLKLRNCVREIGALAAMLPKSLVRKLHLRGGRQGLIRDAGAEAIAAVLPKTQIHTLGLVANSIGDAGAEAIAAVLPKTQIHTLDLAHNEIGDAGAEAIAAVLPKTQIHTLDLTCREIGDAGARAIAAVLPKTHIQKLKMGGTFTNINKSILQQIKFLLSKKNQVKTHKSIKLINIHESILKFDLLDYLSSLIETHFSLASRGRMRNCLSAIETQLSDYRFAYSQLSPSEIRRIENRLRTVLTRLVTRGVLKERRDWAQLALTLELSKAGCDASEVLAWKILSLVFPAYQREDVNTKFMRLYATRQDFQTLPERFKKLVG